MLLNNYEYELYFNSIYCFTAYLVILCAISIEIKHNQLIINKFSNKIIFLPLIGLILNTGFRSYEVGTDTINYYDFYWLTNPEINFKGEFLFPLIIKFLHSLNLTYTYFLLLIALLLLSFIYKSLVNYTQLYQANLLMSFFAFMSFFFFSSISINVIRQGLSLSILLYVFTLFFKKSNKLKLLIFILLALALHLTSVIPIILILFAYYLSLKGNKVVYLLVFIYFVIIILSFINIGFANISPYLSQLLGGNERSGYISGETYDYIVGFKPQFVAFNTFFLLIALYVRKNIIDPILRKQYNLILIYYVMSSWLLFLAFQLPFSDRWGLFSWIVIPFLIIPLFYSPYVKGKIRIHYIFMLILIYIGFKFYAG